MKSAPFEYRAPDSVDETVALLSEYGDDAKVLAGGQSLVPLMSLRLAHPAVLVDLNGIAELGAIGSDDGRVTIRAIARERAGSLVVERCPAHLKSPVDVWGDVGDAIGIMRRIKAKLDPAGILNPGRFVGGI